MLRKPEKLLLKPLRVHQVASIQFAARFMEREMRRDVQPLEEPCEQVLVMVLYAEPHQRALRHPIEKVLEPKWRRTSPLLIRRDWERFSAFL